MCYGVTNILRNIYTEWAKPPPLTVFARKEKELLLRNTLFSSVAAGRTIAGTITAANIVGAMIASREIWASVANCVERILWLKKKYLEAAKHVGAPS